MVVIGRGRLGGRVARAVSAQLVGGREHSLEVVRAAEVIVIAVPDPAIESVAERIAPVLDASHVVLHCAGSRGRDVLASCAARGASTGVMHPLVAIASEESVLADRTFVIDGDARAIDAASRIARACEARVMIAPLHGAAYHAAAALVANGSTALAAVGVSILERLGATREDAERAVAGLLASVAQNVASVGVPRALTGPIARGDAGTVGRHREALAEIDREALAAYDGVAPAVLDVASRAGLDPKARRAIRRALSGRSSASPAGSRRAPRRR
ncbi:Ketopantoate reductase PanG [Sandaracinus amylolyticus]|nr:Ketopantoate reductase PanG [Sandaracinus amylolyticus]